MTVRLSWWSRKKLVNTGESLIEQSYEIIFQHNFQFIILIVLTVIHL